MKFKFTSKSKQVAEKFQQYIKADRNVESSLVEKDNKFHVEYSVADYCETKTADANCEYLKLCDFQDVMSRYAQYFFQEMQYQFNWVWAEIDNLYSAFYDHKKGHLPPINGAEKMEKALTALGIAEDYEVMKPIVWVQASRRNPAGIEIDISAK